MDFIRETINFDSKAEWLSLRRKDITSTEAAGLFNEGAYENSRTFYELYQLKSGAIAPKPFKENDRTVWGNRLEAAIANGIAEDLGLIVEPFKVYMRIPELGAGSSFDFKIVGIADSFDGDETARDMFRQYGDGVMEVKNIDAMQFRRNWIEDGESIEATVQIEMQVQHQLLVSGLKWAIIAPLVGGNTPKVIYRLRDDNAAKAIAKKAKELWQRIENNNPPQPDFVKDAETIAKVFVQNDGSEVDLSDNDRLIALCVEYKLAGIDEKAAKQRKGAAKAEILTIIQSAKTAKAGDFKIGAGTKKETFRAYDREAGERWTITRSEIPTPRVETVVPAFRNLRISTGK